MSVTHRPTLHYWLILTGGWSRAKQNSPLTIRPKSTLIKVEPATTVLTANLDIFCKILILAIFKVEITQNSFWGKFWNDVLKISVCEMCTITILVAKHMFTWSRNLIVMVPRTLDHLDVAAILKLNWPPLIYYFWLYNISVCETCKWMIVVAKPMITTAMFK